jgi:methionyl-tRNA synthetase
LLKLKVEIGGEIRQIVSGISKYYSPEDMVGKTVIVVANLKPVRLKGEDSFGMILAAESNDKLSLVTIEESLPTGSVIR